MYDGWFRKGKRDVFNKFVPTKLELRSHEIKFVPHMTFLVLQIRMESLL